MIFNDSPKVMELGFLEELRDVFEHALETIEAEKGLYFPLIISDKDVINAYAGIRGIELTQGLIKKLYAEILGENTFRFAVDGIIKRYCISDNIYYINAVILNLSISISFFHELGHIVSGHIDYNKIRNIKFFNEVPDLIENDGMYKERSIIEYDADVYAGKSIAGLVHNNLLIECSPDIKIIVEEQLIQISSFALFYILNSMGSDEKIYTYPPYLWRMYTISRVAKEGLAELTEHGKFLEKSMELDLSDMNTADFRSLKNDISEIIKQNNNGIDIFSDKKLQQWLDYYYKHRGMLENVHKCIEDPRSSIFYKKNR